MTYTEAVDVAQQMSEDEGTTYYVIRRVYDHAPTCYEACYHTRYRAALADGWQYVNVFSNGVYAARQG
jgi:hypothetical protein